MHAFFGAMRFLNPVFFALGVARTSNPSLIFSTKRSSMELSRFHRALSCLECQNEA